MYKAADTILYFYISEIQKLPCTVKHLPTFAAFVAGSANLLQLARVVVPELERLAAVNRALWWKPLSDEAAARNASATEMQLARGLCAEMAVLRAQRGGASGDDSVMLPSIAGIELVELFQTKKHPV